MTKIANVPTRMAFYIREEIIHKRRTLGKEVEIKIKPTFACNADKENQRETAKRWATRSYYYYEKEKKPENFDIVERDNLPFSNLEIYDIDIRSEGGRAYKVKTEEGWAFDCREDTILDTIIEDGILSGGRMSGKYIWVMDGSQMKITREGSELHQAAVKHMNKKKRKKIKTSDLEVGGVYKNLIGDSMVFLGRKRDSETKKLMFAFRYINAWRDKDHIKEWKKERRRKYELWLKDRLNPPKQDERHWWRDRNYSYQRGHRWSVTENGVYYELYSGIDPRDFCLITRTSFTVYDKIGQFSKEELKELMNWEEKDNV